MRIAVDAMGGDNAPGPLVAGAVNALRETDVEVVLVGDEEQIRACLPPEFTGLGDRLTIEHTADVIRMDEPGTQALRRPDASVCRAARMVADGAADAVVTMGNTAAATVAGVKYVECIEGVKRPAIGLCLPNVTDRPFILVDAGATSDCTPEILLQFGVMGATYMRDIVEVDAPRVGLLSIGEEPGKGNELVKAAFKKLQESDLSFIGNVEPCQLTRGEADVAVADGFTGNILLKTIEAFVELSRHMFRDEFQRDAYSKLAALVARPVFYRVFHRQNYDRWGGAVVLGVKGVFVIGHGKSNAVAVTNAIRVARDAVQSGVVRHIQETMSKLAG